MRRTNKLAAALIAVPMMIALAVPPAGAAVRSIAPACAGSDGQGARFADVPASNPHAAAIDCIVQWQITLGAAPGRYEPAGHVTRGQMASFIGRLSMWSSEEIPAVPDAFRDDDGSPHEPYIDMLAAAGIVTGRADGSYGANEVVRRDQMATFLVRALEFALGEPLATGAPDAFADDGGSPHEGNIDAAAAVGLAGGTSATRFDPKAPVRRDQMASFLARGLSEAVERSSYPVP